MAQLELLLTDERKIIHGPSCSDINTALRALFSKNDSWATLSDGPFNFVSAKGSQKKGLTLKYEMGSADMHYRVKEKNLDINTIIHVFQAFAKYDDSWFNKFKWERVRLNDIDNKRLPEYIVVKPNMLS